MTEFADKMERARAVLANQSREKPTTNEIRIKRDWVPPFYYRVYSYFPPEVDYKGRLMETGIQMEQFLRRSNAERYAEWARNR